MSHSISTAYPQICSTLRLSSYFIPDICDGAGVLKIDIYAKHSSFFTCDEHHLPRTKMNLT